MNDWFQKAWEKVRELWGKWSTLQKAVLIGIVVAAIAAIIVLFSVSSAPSMVPLLNTPVKDEKELTAITQRLEAENVHYSVSPEKMVMVPDDKIAKRMRSILIREDLVPKGTDPWAIFDIDRWTITDFERNVNLRRAITQTVKEHIEALDDVDQANVTIVMPDKQLFQEDQSPVTASIILFPKPGSDIASNRKKIEGIQKIIKFAVEGLKDENIVITDESGVVLNDFASMQDFDRLELTKRELKLVTSMESQYKVTVLKALQQIYTQDRVRDLNLKIQMDQSKKHIQAEEYYPVTIKPRTPGLPYDDSVIVPSVTRSKTTSTYKWTGTGYNPQGPAGVEGQTPPAYKDMSNLAGSAEQTTTTQNEEINKRNITEDRSPQIDRVSVSVNIDGSWKMKTDPKTGKVLTNPDGSIQREYIALTDTELKNAQALVQDAVGYDKARGDSVTVQNIAVDRTAQFEKEDRVFVHQQQVNQIILYSLIGLAVILISFIVFRLFSRELERRRRLKEEELSRQHQLMRENALRQAEEEGVEVSMSVEERKRLEMQDNAINMAREHPEDVAQLIRTWLMEE